MHAHGLHNAEAGRSGRMRQLLGHERQQVSIGVAPLVGFFLRIGKICFAVQGADTFGRQIIALVIKRQVRAREIIQSVALGF